MRFVDLRSGGPTDPIRPSTDDEPLEAVREIIEQVRNEGDAALFELTERFDGVKLKELRVPEGATKAAADAADPDLIKALEVAYERIYDFAERQSLGPWEAEIGGGLVGERVHPVPRAGMYVPGGRAAYPSSVLMAGAPAAVAGVKEVALCVPPGRNRKIAGPTLAAAHVAGIEEIYMVGGAQAIAAMAYGTESIRKTDVIVGPGNIYVALAKKEVAGTVGIDSVAGPSEILIVTDGFVDPRILAFDLVAQAEHGPGGAFVLVSWNNQALTQVRQAVDALLREVGASAQLRSSLEDGCSAVWVSDLEQAVDFANDFAPEHLELIFDGAGKHIDRFRSAGSIFVGPYTPVSIGDYLGGTNHVLPTGGAGRWASGLRTSHFQRATAVTKHTKESLAQAAAHIETLAKTEGLPLHAGAVQARLR
ncbi:MAG: histidinol dehydrogenase [Actinomycetota bacterium]